MRSIENQVLKSLVIGQALVIGSVVGGIYWLGARSLTETFDARLDEKVRTLATLVRQEGPLIELAFSEQLMPGYSRVEDPEYFQVWIVDAGTLERSDTLGDGVLEEPQLTLNQVRHRDATLPDGRSGRRAEFSILVHEYEPVDDEGRTASQRTTSVVVAVSAEPLEHQLWVLRGGLAAMSALLMGLSAFLIRRSLRRGIRPIGEFARRIGAIDHPDQRPDLAALLPPKEIQPVTESVDRMLERLASAFERERRLTGNIAHELRTPIAELRTAMDVALLEDGDAVGLRSAAREARDIAAEMDQTISALLRVWRGEQDAEQALASASLNEAVVTAIGHSKAKAQARGMQIAGTPGPDAHVAVSEKPLSLVVGNLVSNAASHGEEGSTIEWTTWTEDSWHGFSIENRHCLGISSHKVDGPFFSTGDASEHAGLGLSLVRALCDASGMRLDLKVTDTRFAARLFAPVIT